MAEAGAAVQDDELLLLHLAAIVVNQGGSNFFELIDHYLEAPATPHLRGVQHPRLQQIMKSAAKLAARRADQAGHWHGHALTILVTLTAQFRLPQLQPQPPSWHPLLLDVLIDLSSSNHSSQAPGGRLLPVVRQLWHCACHAHPQETAEVTHAALTLCLDLVRDAAHRSPHQSAARHVMHLDCAVAMLSSAVAEAAASPVQVILTADMALLALQIMHLHTRPASAPACRGTHRGGGDAAGGSDAGGGGSAGAGAAEDAGLEEEAQRQLRLELFLRAHVSVAALFRSTASGQFEANSQAVLRICGCHAVEAAKPNAAAVAAVVTQQCLDALSGLVAATGAATDVWLLFTVEHLLSLTEQLDHDDNPDAAARPSSCASAAPSRTDPERQAAAGSAAMLLCALVASQPQAARWAAVLDAAPLLVSLMVHHLGRASQHVLVVGRSVVAHSGGALKGLALFQVPAWVESVVGVLAAAVLCDHSDGRNAGLIPVAEAVLEAGGVPAAAGAQLRPVLQRCLRHIVAARQAPNAHLHHAADQDIAVTLSRQLLQHVLHGVIPLLSYAASEVRSQQARGAPLPPALCAAQANAERVTLAALRLLADLTRGPAAAQMLLLDSPEPASKDITRLLTRLPRACFSGTPQLMHQACAEVMVNLSLADGGACRHHILAAFAAPLATNGGRDDSWRHGRPSAAASPSADASVGRGAEVCGAAAVAAGSVPLDALLSRLRSLAWRDPGALVDAFCQMCELAPTVPPQPLPPSLRAQSPPVTAAASAADAAEDEAATAAAGAAC